MIPYGRQNINNEDILAVESVLRSNFLTQGPFVPDFENFIASYCNVNYAIAANSATSALHLACLALGVGEGDIVWTSPITFVASANCALYCGANIDFVDIDPQTYNMSVQQLSEKLELAEKIGKLPKVVIPVHLSGQSCDMSSIAELAKKYKFKILEDASHAIGAKYQNLPVGNCKFSDITVFSFHPVKIITTGEGGMAVTNNEELAKKIRLLRSHGITRDENDMKIKSNYPWYYEQIELGFNYRMTDIQAALGLSQIKRIDNFIEKRHQIANKYDKLLESAALVKPFRSEDCYSSFHLYIILLKNNSKFDHLTTFKKLREEGIGVNLHYIPLYKHPFYKKINFQLIEAENYYSRAISLPIYFDLSEEEQDYIVKALYRCIG